MLALIGNLDFFEVILILVVSVVVFGDRLPEVAMKAAAHLVKLRRTVMQMWREAGLEDELRRVQREINLDVKKLPNPRQYIEQKVEGLVDAEPAFEREPDAHPPVDEGHDPDAHRVLDGDRAASGGAEGEPHLVVAQGTDAGSDRREPLAEAADADGAEPHSSSEGDASSGEERAEDERGQTGRETA
jgi:Sec-independent protein translocase protein TatA